MSSQVYKQEPRGEGELPGGAGELHAARQPRPAAVVGVEDGEGVRLDVGVELVLHHDVDERLGPVGEHAADVVPVEAVEEVAPVLEVRRQGVRVEPVVDSLGKYRRSAIQSALFGAVLKMAVFFPTVSRRWNLGNYLLLSTFTCI